MAGHEIIEIVYLEAKEVKGAKVNAGIDKAVRQYLEKFQPDYEAVTTQTSPETSIIVKPKYGGQLMNDVEAQGLMNELEAEIRKSNQEASYTMTIKTSGNAHSDPTNKLVPKDKPFQRS